MNRRFTPLSALRTLLGIRRRRALLPAGPKPRPGARIFAGDMRLAVTDEMPDSLWLWLSRLGWREITFYPDRRRYQDIQQVWARRLYEAQPEQWAQVLLEATVAARAQVPHPQAYGETDLRRQSHRLPEFSAPGRRR